MGFQKHLEKGDLKKKKNSELKYQHQKATLALLPLLVTLLRNGWSSLFKQVYRSFTVP